MSDNDAVLLEDMNHKFDVILEYVAPLASVPEDIRQLKEDMAEVKGDIRVIKAVITDHSALLLNHDQRLTKLESRAA